MMTVCDSGYTVKKKKSKQKKKRREQKERKRDKYIPTKKKMHK